MVQWTDDGFAAGGCRLRMVLRPRVAETSCRQFFDNPWTCGPKFPSAITSGNALGEPAGRVKGRSDARIPRGYRFHPSQSSVHFRAVSFWQNQSRATARITERLKAFTASGQCWRGVGGVRFPPRRRNRTSQHLVVS